MDLSDQQMGIVAVPFPVEVPEVRPPEILLGKKLSTLWPSPTLIRLNGKQRNHLHRTINKPLRRVTHVDVSLTHPGPDRLDAVSRLMRETAHRPRSVLSSVRNARTIRSAAAFSSALHRRDVSFLELFVPKARLHPCSHGLQSSTTMGDSQHRKSLPTLRPEPITELRQGSDQELCRNQDLAGGLQYHLLALH